MKKLKNYLFFAAIISIGISFSSCESSTDIDLENNVTTATDYTSLLSILDLDEVDEATDDDALKSTSNLDLARCFEVTIHENDNSEFWPRSWTFSFADSSCTDFFGNTKLGSVNILLTDFWKKDSSSRTITYEDFSINGNKMGGTRNILNTGLNENENLTFERSFQDASYSRADTATMTWESSRMVEMIAGYDTFLAADDEYLVNGGASGINFDEKTFTVDITNVLHYKKCSQFPVSGSITIQVEGESSIYIDYGEGECDKLANMTVEDITTEITLGFNN